MSSKKYTIGEYDFSISNRAIGYIIDIKDWIDIFKSAIPNFDISTIENVKIKNKLKPNYYTLSVNSKGNPIGPTLSEFKSGLVYFSRKNKWNKV